MSFISGSNCLEPPVIAGAFDLSAAIVENEDSEGKACCVFEALRACGRRCVTVPVEQRKKDLC
jgi:hypothetical protein